MPSDEMPALTPNQILALVVLMAEARKVDNNELRELAGFSLTGADNKKLEKLGLVETDRSRRLLAHQLTDHGWRVMRELHMTEPPKAGKSASRTLLTLLGNVQRGLEQLRFSHGVKLSAGEFFRRPSFDVEMRIREAYAALVPNPGDWLGLADLRDRLTDLDRAAVDEGLRSMVGQQDVRIIPVANTKALKPRDVEAAVEIGGEESHTLSIGRP